MELRKGSERNSPDQETETETEIVLKKHVGLIHCENKLTLLQRKICNILLFNALDQINNCDIHEISLKKLCNLVGYNSNDSKLIKESIKALIATVMEWNLLEDRKFICDEDYPEDAITWNASSLLAGATIRNGMIRYSYSPQMKAVLSSLEIYGRINLFVQAKFNSSYSLVLYENCVRFKNIQQTSWFSIDLFRSLMGIPDGKYASFKELRRSVINVAIKEINLKSDITIEPLFKRSSRHITAVQFMISDNKSYQPSFKKVSHYNMAIDSKQQQSMFIEVLMSEFRLSKKQVQDLLMDYQHDYLLEKIKLVKSKKKVDHPAAYLLAALKQDYKANENKHAISERKAAKHSYQREAREASEITPLKNKYMSYKLKAYLTFIQEQTESIQRTIRQKFEQHLKPNAAVFRYYKKSGFTSPFVMTGFLSFIEEHFPHVIGEYLNFDDFITSDEG